MFTVAVTESQLETWSHQGAVTTAIAAHELIRNALNSDQSLIRERNFDIYLQGSYKNDTNIREESDVDIVVQLNDTFQKDLSALSPQQKSAYSTAYDDATYLWPQFRADVLQTLRNHSGTSSILEGNKSLKLPRDSGRLPADIVVCLQYRKYSTFVSQSSQSYVEGIVFYTRDDRRVISFPKSHYDNGVAKNSRTNTWFKPTVRMIKNARGSLVSSGVISEDTAPSYFLESLLYNVPNGNFGPTFRDTYYKVVNCLNSYDITNLSCQDEQLQLFGDEPEQWSVRKANQFIAALVQLWNNS